MRTPVRARRGRFLSPLPALLALVLAVAPVTPALGTTVAPLVNPAANIAPRPNIFASGPCQESASRTTCANPCLGPGTSWTTGGDSPRCASFTLAAINYARARLDERALTLPSNWTRLTYPEQLFVIADMERMSAGYPAYLGLNRALTHEATRAAATRSDPGIAPGFALGRNPFGQPGFDGAWATGTNVLAADFLWMYDDGWGGSTRNTPNRLCTGPGVWACWSHRDQLLGSSTDRTAGVGLTCSTCEMGAAFAPSDGGSLVDLIERPAGRPPAMTFTWARELAFFAPGSNRPSLTRTGSAGATVSVSEVTAGSGQVVLAWSLSTSTASALVARLYASVDCSGPARVEIQSLTGLSSGTLVVPAAGSVRSVRLRVDTHGSATASGCVALAVG